MYVYRIKVTSDRKIRLNQKYKMLDLKLFKHNDLINKTRSSSEDKFYPSKKNLTEKPSRDEREYTSFILNRYNSHLLMEYLFADNNGQPVNPNGYSGKNKSKKNIGNRYSYAISFKPANNGWKFSACSKYNAYLILKSNKKIDQRKIDEINQIYRKLTGRKKIPKQLNDPQFIKIMDKVKKFEHGKLIFKKSSPVVLKSTIKQIINPSYSNEFYQEIYERNNVQEQIKNFYSYNTGKERESKSIYFVPEGIAGLNSNPTTPVVVLTEKDYLSIAMQSLGLTHKNEKLINPRLSIIKVNKPAHGYESMFNVFGVAFELQDASKEVFERANVNGLGHYTGFGFGFAYTVNQSSKAVEAIQSKNCKLGSNNQNDTNHNKRNHNRNSYNQSKAKHQAKDEKPGYDNRNA